VRDAVAEMAARAHEISLEAGSKMAAAMKDVIGAAAGLTAFALESARELVQYMVRRGQMTQDEADKLMRDVEHAHGTKPKAKASAAPAKQEKAAKPAVKAAAPAPTPVPAQAAKPKAKAAPKAAAKAPAKKNPKKK
jgi:polyhydroxyalkanoate synthesis regulator phasin